MPNIGFSEWWIILIIVLLIFGVGRISKLGEELGKGIRSFREGVRGGSEGELDKSDKAEENKSDE